MSLLKRIESAEQKLGAGAQMERGAVLHGLMRYALVQRHLATVNGRRS